MIMMMIAINDQGPARPLISFMPGRAAETNSSSEADVDSLELAYPNEFAVALARVWDKFKQVKILKVL